MNNLSLNLMKNRVIVEICDKEYTLKTDDSEDYYKSLAAEVDKMIDDMAYKNLRTSKSDAAVLTCLDLCDKNRKLTDDNDNMRKRIAEYLDEIQVLHKTLASYERKKSPAGKGGKPGIPDEEEASALEDPL